jgi:hypothetical protein
MQYAMLWECKSDMWGRMERFAVQTSLKRLMSIPHTFSLLLCKIPTENSEKETGTP